MEHHTLNKHKALRLHDFNTCIQSILDTGRLLPPPHMTLSHLPKVMTLCARYFQLSKYLLPLLHKILNKSPMTILQYTHILLPIYKDSHGNNGKSSF